MNQGNFEAGPITKEELEKWEISKKFDRMIEQADKCFDEWALCLSHGYETDQSKLKQIRGEGDSRQIQQG